MFFDKSPVMFLDSHGILGQRKFVIKMCLTLGSQLVNTLNVGHRLAEQA